MKKILTSLLCVRNLVTILLLASVSLANAASPLARYLRFDGYGSTDNGQINIYEIEAYSGALNVARTATVTTNSGGSTNTLIDGNTSGSRFSTNRNNPGQPSVNSPHRIEIDFGTALAIDRIRVFFEGSQVYTFGLFISVNGVDWTQVGNYNSVNGLVTNTLSTPVAQVISATMRASTGIMDVVYRINDPDNPTVKVRALAFTDGIRSFSNVLRPVTFVEGTASNIGDAITTNVNHTLSWNVGADWNISLGSVKFEILARAARGLLAFDWISIPAVPGHAAVSVSKNTPSNSAALDAFFWLYAATDPGLTFAGGTLTGTPSSGVFAGLPLLSGTTLQNYAVPYLLKKDNRDFAPLEDVSYATTARAAILNPTSWHASKRNWAGITPVIGWGENGVGSITIPAGLTGVTAIAAGIHHSLALKNDGTVVGWGSNNQGQTTIPLGLTGIIAISAGYYHNLALKSNGTVTGWGSNDQGQTTIPAGLTGVIAVAAGYNHSLALKNDGTVIGWGYNGGGQTTIPLGLSGVIAIAMGDRHSLALKQDGTVVGWGANGQGQTTIPAGLTGVIAIAAQSNYNLALKSNGTVVSWGLNLNFDTVTIPAGLTGVNAIAAGGNHSLALKNGGTVVGWGSNDQGQINVPAGLTGVSAIAAGGYHSLALKALAQ